MISPSRGIDSGVARDRKPLMNLVNVPDVLVEDGDLLRRVGRAVIHKQHFVIRII